MPRAVSYQNTMGSKLTTLFVILLLIANTVILGFNVKIVDRHLAHNEQLEEEEGSDLEYKQGLARNFLHYNRLLASELGVTARDPVRGALAAFSYDIDLATTNDEVILAVLNHGQRTREIIIREWDRRVRDQVLVTLNRDPLISEIEDGTAITLRISQEEGAMAEPEGLFGLMTLEEVREVVFTAAAPATEIVITLKAENGVVSESITRDPRELVQLLTEELDAIRVQLHETRVAAGYAELSGPGVNIKLFDAVDGHLGGTIIHDTDVRDLVNELFASGAEGVAVGGRRLTATSSIRCVGPVIKVDDQHIPVNPVTVTAIGDPEVLATGLYILRNTWVAVRGMQIEQMEIEQVESLTLPTYKLN